MIARTLAETRTLGLDTLNSAQHPYMQLVEELRVLRLQRVNGLLQVLSQVLQPNHLVLNLLVLRVVSCQVLQVLVAARLRLFEAKERGEEGEGEGAWG